MSTKSTAAAALRALGANPTDENRRAAYAAMYALYQERPSDWLWGMVAPLSRPTMVSQSAMNQWASDIERY